MRQSVRFGLVGSIVAAWAATAAAQVPQTKGQPGGPPASKTAAPAQAPPGGNAQPKLPPRPAILDQVLATVNGEPITRGDFIGFLSKYDLSTSASTDEEKYNVAIDGLASTRLISQYLAKQEKLVVTEKDVDAEYNSFAEAVKRDSGQDIAIVLASSGMTLPQVRNEIKNTIRWRKYVQNVATDDTLKKFVEANKDVFNNTLVKISHIVLRADATAPAADKAKIREKLVGIKKEVDAGKISFADAANKYSQDDVGPGGPAGGDLGYIARKGQVDPTFSTAAFSLKQGVVSEPIETPFGFHLIQVTDRKEGTPANFERDKPRIIAEYAADLQERIVTEMRKTAKIDVKPIPPDLFQPAPAAAAGSQPPPAAGATPKGAAPAGPTPKGAAPAPGPR